MKKVYITGRGLITPLGIGKEQNTAALQNGKSGVVFMPNWAELNLDSQVAGQVPAFEPSALLDRKKLRFCPPNAVMSVNAVSEALEEAKISLEDIKQLKIAVICGVAGSYFLEIYENAAKFAQTKRVKDISAFVVPRVMPSSAAANLSLIFGFTGESYDISAACASSALSIMAGCRLVESGAYDIVVCGGAEQLDWVQCLGFCAMRALSKKNNDNPQAASRPFDRDRDGFVLAEGAGYVVLESEESVRRRNINPVSLISGYASNSNAKDMVVPDAFASENVMREAVANAGLKPEDISYINTHGTATSVGDPIEMEAIKNIFGGNTAINSTKSMTGHMIGATGAVEVIFTTLMQEHNFIAPSINLDNPDETFAWADLVRQTRYNVSVKHALSNSFAFGGSNISLILTDCCNK